MSQHELALTRIKQLCYSGLPIGELQTALSHELQRVWSVSAYCFNQIDPTTELMVRSQRKDVGGPREQRFFLENLYFEDYLPAFRRLAQGRMPVEMLSRSTGGRLEKAYRYASYLRGLGFGDELRTIMISGRRPWGSLVLFRRREDPHFAPEEQQLLARLVPHIGAGMQRAVLQSLCSPAEQHARSTPGVMILGPGGELEYFTPAAEAWLKDIDDLPSDWPQPRLLPVPVLHATGALRISLAMRTEAEAALVPRVSVLGRSGTWLTIHASRMESPAGGNSRTMVMLEPSLPQDLGRIQTAAFGLTQQEETVAHLVFQGKSTQEMAQELFISAYTVQDHLKNVFDKVGVRSRRDLVKHLYLHNQLALAK